MTDDDTFEIPNSMPPPPPPWIQRSQSVPPRSSTPSPSGVTKVRSIGPLGLPHVSSTPDESPHVGPEDGDPRIKHEITLAVADPGALPDVENFVREKGLELVGTDARSVRARGDVGQLSRACGVDLAEGSINGRDFLYHTRAVRLPKKLEGKVSRVFGLHTAGVARPAGLCRPPTAEPEEQAIWRGPAVPRMASPVVGYTIDEVRKLYDFPEGDGEGRTVAIIALAGGYSEETMRAFFEQRGIDPPTIISTNKLSFGNSPINDFQVMQNLQIVAALVPKARLVICSPEKPDPSVKGAHDAFSQAESYAPDVIINPWGFVENASGTFGVGINQEDTRHFDELFQALTKDGTTICSASGSAGGTYAVAEGTVWPAVNYPASSPYVLGVGGTTLSTGSSNGLRQEQVWNTVRFVMKVEDTASNAGATGGGYSSFYPLPTYQKDLGLPAIPQYSWSAEGSIGVTDGMPRRGIPDVSMVADSLTGVQILFPDTQGKPRWVVSGGTGVSVSFWGALVVLLNEYVYGKPGSQDTSAGVEGRRIDELNAKLYQIARAGAVVSTDAPFSLINEGNNGAWDASSPALWNPCCGLGVPVGKKLAAALRQLHAGG